MPTGTLLARASEGSASGGPLVSKLLAAMCGRLVPSSSSSVLSPGQENVRRSIRLPALLAVEVQAKPGRPPEARRRASPPDPRMARENPTWGRRRIRAELALLGYEVAELTVAKYMHRTVAPALANVARLSGRPSRDIVAIDFFLVSTLTFRLLFVFVVLRHDRRETPPPQRHRSPHGRLDRSDSSSRRSRTDSAPKYLLRDRDAIYGEEFARRVERMGIREVLTAPRAPWQNPFVERVIGSIRRECLDHFLILNEAHLYRLLRAYLAYYNPRVPIKRSTTTVPNPETSSPLHVAGSSPFPRSAGSITAISASPDRGRAAAPRSFAIRRVCAFYLLRPPCQR